MKESKIQRTVWDRRTPILESGISILLWIFRCLDTDIQTAHTTRTGAGTPSRIRSTFGPRPRGLSGEQKPNARISVSRSCDQQEARELRAAALGIHTPSQGQHRTLGRCRSMHAVLSMVHAPSALLSRAFGFWISDGHASVDCHPQDFEFSVPRNPWSPQRNPWSPWSAIQRLQPPHKLTFPQILDAF